MYAESGRFLSPQKAIFENQYLSVISRYKYAKLLNHSDFHGVFYQPYGIMGT